MPIEPLPPGTLIGDYVAGSTVGEGGNAIVYSLRRADADGPSLVAKELAIDGLVRRDPLSLSMVADDPKLWSVALDQFRSEYERMQSLEYLRAFPLVYGWLDDRNTGYIIEERIDGYTLADRPKVVDAQQRADRARTIAAQLADHLAPLHQQGLVHNDVSPKNVMWETRARRVRIIDLDTVRIAGHLSAHGLKATMAFVAPERRRDGVGSAQTEVYSVAAIAYLLLTDAYPPNPTNHADDATGLERAWDLVRHELDAARSREPQLVEAIERGLSPDLGIRPRTVTAWKELLVGTSRTPDSTPPAPGPAPGPAARAVGPADDRNRYQIVEDLPSVGAIARYRGVTADDVAVLLCQGSERDGAAQVEDWKSQGLAINRAHRDSRGGLANFREAFTAKDPLDDIDSDRCAWTVFEWIDEPPIGSRTWPDLGSALRALLPAAKALDSLHSLGLRHGRVSAANLLSDGNRVALVGHLAFTKLPSIADAEGRTRQTRDDVDLFGLAAVVYTVATSQTPRLLEHVAQESKLLSRVVGSEEVGRLYAAARDGSYRPSEPLRLARWVDELLVVCAGATERRTDTEKVTPGPAPVPGPAPAPTERMPPPPPPLPDLAMPRFAPRDLLDLADDRSANVWSLVAVMLGLILGVATVLATIGTP